MRLSAVWFPAGNPGGRVGPQTGVHFGDARQFLGGEGGENSTRLKPSSALGISSPIAGHGIPPPVR